MRGKSGQGTLYRERERGKGRDGIKKGKPFEENEGRGKCIEIERDFLVLRLMPKRMLFVWVRTTKRRNRMILDHRLLLIITFI